MKLGLINSVFAQTGFDTQRGIEETRRIGFDAIDIFADPLEIDAAERRLVKSTADRCDLPIKSLCCVATGLIDFNGAVRRFHLDRCRAYLDFARELGCDNLLLVLGEYIWQKQVIPPEQQWRTGVASVQELGAYAAGLGLEIALELEPFELSLVNTVDTMLHFLNDVDMAEVVRANCDISHLYLMHIGPEQIQRLAGRIAHVHLSDCNGLVHGDLPPGHGVVPLQEYLAALQAVGFNGTVSIELEYPPESASVVDWVAEAYQRTDEMMQALNCRD